MTTEAINKLGICNLALAMIGEESIQQFTKANARERLCEVFYPASKRFVLSRASWTTARTIVELQQLASVDDDLKTAQFVYQLPSDCLRPVDISPFNCRKYWKIVENKLHCNYSECFLLYISGSISEARFNSPLEQSIAAHLATQIAMPLTQSKTVRDVAREDFAAILTDSIESDANVGSDDLDPDRDPENSKFVNPEGYYNAQDEDFSKRYLLDADS